MQFLVSVLHTLCWVFCPALIYNYFCNVVQKIQAKHCVTNENCFDMTVRVKSNFWHINTYGTYARNTVWD